MLLHKHLWLMAKYICYGKFTVGEMNVSKLLMSINEWLASCCSAAFKNMVFWSVDAMKDIQHEWYNLYSVPQIDIKILQIKEPTTIKNLIMKTAFMSVLIIDYSQFILWHVASRMQAFLSNCYMYFAKQE